MEVLETIVKGEGVSDANLSDIKVDILQIFIFIHRNLGWQIERTLDFFQKSSLEQ